MLSNTHAFRGTATNARAYRHQWRPDWGSPLNPSVLYYRGVEVVSEESFLRSRMMLRGASPSVGCTPDHGRDSS